MEPSALIRLSGFLAEHAVQAVHLSSNGVDRTLTARSTDLPGELASLAARGGTLTATELDLVVRFEPGSTGISWQCGDTAVTLRLAAALATR